MTSSWSLWPKSHLLGFVAWSLVTSTKFVARDKNNANVNRTRINHFRTALQTCELHEIHLQNRRFTWSNEKENPTLCKLDAFYCNNDWDICFGSHVLNTLSLSLSDHCPFCLLMIEGQKGLGPSNSKTFGLIRIPGFMNVVSQAWAVPTTHLESCHVFFPRCTANALTK
jgi:hypothetical protein